MKITINNYKPFKGKTSIDLKPITIIIGKNNAGKTSLTNFIDLQINSANALEIDDILDRIDSSSISQLVNFHKWKYIPEEIHKLLNTNRLSAIGEKRLEGIFKELNYSPVQKRIVNNIFENENKYYADKTAFKRLNLQLMINNSSKSAKGRKEKLRLEKQLKKFQNLDDKLQLKREKLFEAFKKLCSYDPELFYQFKNSGKMIEARMSHWSFQHRDLTLFDSNIGESFITSKYNNRDDDLRLFTIIDTLKPNFSAGLRFTHELNYDLAEYDRMNESNWAPIAIDYFDFIIKRMYEGVKTTSFSELQTSFPKRKRHLENTLYNKKYLRGRRGFSGMIYNHFYEVDRLFKLNSTLPVHSHFNVTERETNISFESKNRLFNGLRIDAKNLTNKEPVKFYFEHHSEMFLKYEKFVKTLISKVAPTLYESCAKDLNANFFSHNRYYYKNTRGGLFNRPSYSLLRKEVRNGHIDNKKLKNTFHASIDNLPYKVIEIEDNSKKSSRFPFEKLPVIQADKFINDTFIQHKSGHQVFAGELSREFLQVFTHKRVDRFKNDVDCIKHYNKLDPSKFLDSIFDYDINNNKVHFKSRPQNPFSTPDLFENIPEEILPREVSINKLISIITDIYEAEDEFTMSRFSQKRYDGRTVNSSRFLREREHFAIGAALASSISKIYEILYEDFIHEYAWPVISNTRIVKRDGDGRRVNRLTSKIISSDHLPIKNKTQSFNMIELRNIFGEDIELVISSESGKNRLIASVNNSLKAIKIPYKVEIDTFSPTMRERVIGEVQYVVSLSEINDRGDIFHTSDFNMVGEGTRSIIASLIQIEVHKITRKGWCFLTIREFENHLHPSLVGRFFEFLVNSTSNTNINLVVETHSEVILRTLQTIVKRSTDNINETSLDPKRVAIYYIDKKGPGETVIDKLILDKSGYFDTEKGSDLPPDFFDINSNLSKELLKD